MSENPLNDILILKYNSQLSAIVQQTWVVPTLVNNWAQKTGFSEVKYTKDSLGFAHLKGVLDGSAATSGTVAFVLPVGFRPLNPTYFPAVSTGSFGSVNISNTGDVKLTGSNVSWFSIAGITFKAEA